MVRAEPLTPRLPLSSEQLAPFQLVEREDDLPARNARFAGDHSEAREGAPRLIRVTHERQEHDALLGVESALDGKHTAMPRERVEFLAITHRRLRQVVAATDR